MLRLRDSQTIARHNDHFGSVFHDKGRIFSRAALNRALFAAAAGRAIIRARAKAAKDNRDKAAVHAFTHNIGQDRTGRADQGPDNNQSEITKSEAKRSRSPARIAIKH